MVIVLARHRRLVCVLKEHRGPASGKGDVEEAVSESEALQPTVV